MTTQLTQRRQKPNVLKSKSQITTTTKNQEIYMCVYFDLWLPYYLNTLPEYTTSPLGFNIIRLVESTGS